MNIAQLKNNAKTMIRGHIGMLFLISLIIALISGVANMIPIIGALIISPAFALSETMIYLNLCDKLTPAVGDAFSGFSNWWSAFKVQFLTGLFTLLWSMLFIIPGIIKGYSYSMSLYILADNPDISALDAIKKSKEMMNGHKMELFLLSLSFIGWILLGILTLGILYIWLIPYMNTTIANFYNSIKSVGDANSAGNNFTQNAGAFAGNNTLSNN